MKLFVCSDIHGEYEGFIDSLNKNGFDINNDSDMVVICGDMFDRGEGNKELYDYILKLIKLNKIILVKGNHEILFDEMCQRRHALSHDIHNGTLKTLEQFTDNPNTYDKFVDGYNMMKPIRNRLLNYFETENYVFVHSVVPYWCGNDWRDADNEAWNDATWENPFKIWEMFGIENKTVVFGHWGTCEYWSETLGISKYGDDAKFDIVYGDGYIGLDGTTILSHQVNMLVIEDNFID